MKILSSDSYAAEPKFRAMSRAKVLRMRLLPFAILGLGAPAAHAVCYVNEVASGHDNGTSWADAYSDLQFALLDTGCDEIWVARGVYKPTPGTDRTAAFDIRPGTALYGGFLSGETNRDVRDPKTNTTILSGDIDNNDTNAIGTQIDLSATEIVGSNSFHVVRMDGTLGTAISSTTILDGVTITGGDASGGPAPTFWKVGGGLFCNGSGSGSACSPTLSNIRFFGNRAESSGGALAAFGEGGESSPLVRNAIFSGNMSDDAGGAVWNQGEFGGTSEPLFDSVTFVNNHATNLGGAMISDGSAGTSRPKFSAVTFENNSAGAGGALFIFAHDSGVNTPNFVNVTFSENRATDDVGGAVFNFATLSGVADPHFTNVTFAGNTSSTGGAMFNLAYDGGIVIPLLRNSILWGDVAIDGFAEIMNNGGAPIIDHTVIQDGCPSASTCTDLITSDPLLEKLGNYGGTTQTLRTNPASPAVDAGDDAICPATDQRGVARPQGTHCDIGAVERQSLEDIIFKDGFERF